MNSIQIADETFVAADPVEVGRAVADPASWRRWWPDLRLTVVEDRGEVGHRWTVAGALTGTMEIWLEPVLDGVVLHYFLHAEPSGVAAWQLAKMNLAKMNHRRRVAGKNMAFEVKRRWKPRARWGCRGWPETSASAVGIVSGCAASLRVWGSSRRPSGGLHGVVGPWWHIDCRGASRTADALRSRG